MWWHVVRRPSVRRPSVNIHLVYAITSVHIVGSSRNFEISIIQKISAMSSNMRCQRSRSQWPEMWFSCLHCNMCKYCLMTTKISNKCCTKNILVRFECDMSRSKVKVTVTRRRICFVYCTSSFKLYKNLNRFQINKSETLSRRDNSIHRTLPVIKHVNTRKTWNID